MDPLLSGVSHIVLDEVHERDLNSDLLLVVLRDLLVHRPDLRIVLMSATLNADMFATYFSQPSHVARTSGASDLQTGDCAVVKPAATDAWDDPPEQGTGSCSKQTNVASSNSESSTNDSLKPYADDSTSREVPTLHIPGFTYPVKDFFLEDALEWTGYDLANDLQGGGGGTRSRHRGRGSGRGRGRGWVSKPASVPSDSDCNGDVAIHREMLEKKGLSAETVHGTLAFVASVTRDPIGDHVPYGLIAELVEKIDRDDPLESSASGQGSDSHTAATSRGGSILVFVPGFGEIVKVRDLLQRNPRLLVLPLHGSMPTGEQRAVFRPAPPGKRKVVVATNIAESSITIEDVSYVASLSSE